MKETAGMGAILRGPCCPWPASLLTSQTTPAGKTDVPKQHPLRLFEISPVSLAVFRD